VETCSSPRFVWASEVVSTGAKGKVSTKESMGVQKGWSLSNGTCAQGSGEVAQQQRVACPWRCTDDGAVESVYCSLNDKTDEFTTCAKC